MKEQEALEKEYRLKRRIYEEQEEELFNQRDKAISIDTKDQEIDCILYDSFIFRCGIEKPRNNFKAGIILDSEHVVTSFLGEKLSLNNDVNSIRKNFELVDYYCRLRLPYKLLEAYDQANKCK